MKREKSLRSSRFPQRIKATGRIFDGEFLKFYYVFDQSASSQVRVIVSKKHGTAVRRNLIKRWIREACQSLIHSTREEGSSSRRISTLVMFKKSKQRPERTASFADIKHDAQAMIEIIQPSVAASK